MSRSERGVEGDTSRPAAMHQPSGAKFLFWGVLLVIGFANLMPNGSIAGTYAAIFGILGVLIFLFPPKYRIPLWLVGAAGALLVVSALALLPRSVAGEQEWRTALEALGLDTGKQITPHPIQTIWYLCAIGACLFSAIALLGHRISIGVQYQLALGFTAIAAGYTGLAMLVQDSGWSILWDHQASFGIFPNRNHSASLMATGGICGLGVFYHAISSKKWFGMVLSGASLGILVWGLLGYSTSRAGVVLLGLGFAVWVLGLGRRYLSTRMVVTIGVLGGLSILLFVAADTEVKGRLKSTVEVSSQDDATQQVSRDDAPLDFRLLVYLDAIRMIGSEPWTGVGLGNFKYVFPQYREASATNAMCVHPESDYLTVASETGILSMLLLMGLCITVFVVTLRRNLGRPSWPLRLSCLLAAAVVPLHGIFDVPGHRVGLGFGAVLLLALNFRPRRSQLMGTFGRVCFRGGAILVFIAGIYLGKAELTRDGVTPLNNSLVAAERMRQLHLEDQTAALAQEEAGGEGEDKLEQAIDIAEAAIRTTPLDPELHHLRGAMALYFDDKEKMTTQSFKIQSRLDPTWVNIPLRQASGWLNVDPQRALALWADAMNRAKRLSLLRKVHDREPARTWSRILQQAKSSDELLELALPIAADEVELLQSWIGRASTDLKRRMLPEILRREQIPLDGRISLLETWRRGESAADARKFIESQPEFQDFSAE